MITKFATDEEIQRLLDDLKEQPDKIRRAKQHAENFTVAGEDSLRMIEIETASEVAAATNGDGKKRFPNETTRKAETEQRLANNAEYQEYKRQVDESKQTKNDLYADVYHLRDQFKAMCAQTDLLASLIMLTSKQSFVEVLLSKIRRKNHDK